jgi:hypothetical protein
MPIDFDGQATNSFCYTYFEVLFQNQRCITSKSHITRTIFKEGRAGLES